MNQLNVTIKHLSQKTKRIMFINNKNEAEVSKSKMSQINYLTLIILLIGGSMLFVMAYYLYYLFV